MSTQTMNKAIADYFKTQPVVRAWIFGSFARGEETPLSDVDLLVQLDYTKLDGFDSLACGAIWSVCSDGQSTWLPRQDSLPILVKVWNATNN